MIIDVSSCLRTMAGDYILPAEYESCVSPDADFRDSKEHMVTVSRSLCTFSAKLVIGGIAFFPKGTLIASGYGARLKSASPGSWECLWARLPGALVIELAGQTRKRA